MFLKGYVFQILADKLKNTMNKSSSSSSVEQKSDEFGVPDEVSASSIQQDTVLLTTTDSRTGVTFPVIKKFQASQLSKVSYR